MLLVFHCLQSTFILFIVLLAVCEGMKKSIFSFFFLGDGCLLEPTTEFCCEPGTSADGNDPLQSFDST